MLTTHKFPSLTVAVHPLDLVQLLVQATLVLVERGSQPVGFVAKITLKLGRRLWVRQIVLRFEGLHRLRGGAGR